MRRTIFGMILALLCSAVMAMEGKAIFSQDFSSSKAENYKLGHNAEVKDGSLVCDRGDFELFFTAEIPVKISFKVRELEIPQGDHHWGFRLTGGDGYSCHVYTRGTGNGFISALTRNGGKVDMATGGTKAVISRGKDTPWSVVDIYVGKKSFGVSVNNESCIVQDVSLLPLKQMTFYGYRVKYEIDDVLVTPLQEKPVTLIEKPVFSASFDNTLDAKDANGKTISPTQNVESRYLPGVSGMGFSPEPNAPFVGFRCSPSWKVTADKEFLGEDGGAVDILVPNLKDFAFEAKFQRLGNVPKADNHFNVGVSAAGKPLCSFHARGNKWWFNNPGQKAQTFQSEGGGKDNLDGKLTLFKLAREGGKLTFSLDGESHELGEVASTAVTGFGFNGYGVKYKLDDVKVSGGAFSLDESFSQAPPAPHVPGVDYALENPFDDKVGGVSFWLKSNDGKGFEAFNLDKKFNAGLSDMGASFDVKRSDAQSTLYYMRRLLVNPGDWHHVALTWQEDGKARFFVDGLPYPVCFIPGQRCPLFFNADLDDLKRLSLGSRGDFTLDELNVYHRPLSNDEIYDQYRAVMPIDLVMERSIVDGEKGEAITLQAAPGGYYMRPYPVPGKPFVKADVKMKLELFDAEGKTLKTENKTLKVDHPLDVAMESVKLPAGNYKLVATVNFGDKSFQRTFDVASFSEQVATATTKEPYQLGKVLFEKNFNDPADKDLVSEGDMVKGALDGVAYLEAGAKKRDRFGCVVSFPKEVIGKPVVLEISWPDDKMRNMGLYMYKESKVQTNRDRLQSGVQSGNEYPNGGKIEKARYLFFPGGENYLFEARTLAPGQPAAVSGISVHELVGELPRLAVHYPENMEGRHFGHTDEDQTFTNNLRVDNELTKEYPRRTLMQNDDLMRYFDYTGQNTMHYPTWRYTYSFNPLEGSIGNGMYPGMPGELSYVFDSFHRHGKKYVAMINFFSLPDLGETDAIQRDFSGEGMVSQDRFGNEGKFFGKKIGNIANPEVRKMFIDYFRDTVKRYARNSGFGGVEWWMNFGAWPSLDVGYDDYTVNAFSKATGTDVPKKVAERHGVLTQEPVRSKWLKWRSEQVTEFIREMRAMLDEYNPDLKLNLAIRQSPDMYEEKGVDLAAIKKLKNITLVAERAPTSYRWEMHWGKPESTQYEEMYDAAAPMIKDFQVDGAVGAVAAGNSYFETFNDSLMPKRFASYFQDADAKQHGRFFLKEPAFAVGAMDALEFVIGQQPLGTLGRDEETREFTQAYCALPAKPFKAIPGLTDPAVARYLNTPNGTYFYVVNMHHSPVEVEIDFGKKSFLGLFGGVDYIDLSTDETLSSDTIALKPFQLRSFLIPNKEVAPLKAELAGVPAETDEFYQKRVADLKDAIARLEKDKIGVEQEKQDVAAVEKALSEKRYAEAHRLAFSRRMNQVFQTLRDIKNIIRRQALIDQGVYRVNCGSFGFYEAPNGQFFFPDQKFDGLYGYVGSYNSVGRDIGKIKGTDTPEIFRTEAYDISGYKFKVPNGVYQATLYVKCGYLPGFNKGNFEFSVKANGKMELYKYDLFTATGGDFDKALAVVIKGIKVTDNILFLEFLYHPTATNPINGTVRLANAIEIEPEKV